MVLQLAEKYYRLPGLSDRLIANRPDKNVRPKAVELVSMLESGSMDYAWEYLLSADGGLKVLLEMGQPPFIPCRVPTHAMHGTLPGNLPKLVAARE